MIDVDAVVRVCWYVGTARLPICHQGDGSQRIVPVATDGRTRWIDCPDCGARLAVRDDWYVARNEPQAVTA